VAYYPYPPWANPYYLGHSMSSATSGFGDARGGEQEERSSYLPSFMTGVYGRTALPPMRYSYSPFFRFRYPHRHVGHMRYWAAQNNSFAQAQQFSGAPQLFGSFPPGEPRLTENGSPFSFQMPSGGAPFNSGPEQRSSLFSGYGGTGESSLSQEIASEFAGLKESAAAPLDSGGRMRQGQLSSYQQRERANNLEQLLKNPGTQVLREAADMVARLKTMGNDPASLKEKIAEVNGFVNSNIEFNHQKVAMGQRGANSNWVQDSCTTLTAQSGVCIDTAFLKTELLKLSGVDSSKMRVISGEVYDPQGRFIGDHAIATVNVDGKNVVLNNQQALNHFSSRALAYDSKTVSDRDFAQSGLASVGGGDIKFVPRYSFDGDRVETLVNERGQQYAAHQNLAPRSPSGRYYADLRSGGAPSQEGATNSVIASNGMSTVPGYRPRFF